MADFFQQFLTEVGNGLVLATNNLVADFFRVIPGLIGAAVLLAVGVFIGKYVKIFVTRLIESTKADLWLSEHKLKDAIGNRDLATIFGSFAKWYVIALFLAQALDLIQMRVLRTFAEFLIGFINSVIAALIILIGGLLVGRYARNVIEATSYRYKRTIAVVIELLIVYVTAVVSLQTIGVNTRILTDAFLVGFTVLILAVAIMGGVVFALAFKRDIVQLAADFKREVGK